MTRLFKSRRALTIWIIVSSLVALVLAWFLFQATVRATVLVDQIPGGDAGLATTPSLDDAYSTMGWSSIALLAVVVGAVTLPVVDLFVWRRRKHL